MNKNPYELYKSLSKEFVKKGIAGNRFGELEQLYKLAEENEKLRNIIQETLWMARRYADGRSTYAPSMVNENIMKAYELGIELDGPIEPDFAKDGMFGEWNPETRSFSNEKK